MCLFSPCCLNLIQQTAKHSTIARQTSKRLRAVSCGHLRTSHSVRQPSLRLFAVQSDNCIELSATDTSLESKRLEADSRASHSGVVPAAITNETSDMKRQTQATQQEQSGGKKKKRRDREGPNYNFDIQMAAKDMDVSRSLAAFQAVCDSNFKLQSNMYNSLLFICTGGEKWEELVRGGAGAGSTGARDIASIRGTGVQPNPNEHNGVSSSSNGGDGGEVPLAQRLEAADKILEHMTAGKVAYDDVTYTALSRLAAIRGQADQALEWARVSTSEKHALRLRNITPALVCFAMQGRVDDALMVDRWVTRDQGLDLTETEYALLIETVAKRGSYSQLRDLLQRMSEELSVLQPHTVKLITDYLTATGAAEATGSEWVVGPCEVDDEGYCTQGSGRLQVLHLKEQEWEAFSNQIASLAMSKQQRPSEFQAFMEWYNRNGPYDILVDGANVAYYGQNTPEGSSFNWVNLKLMMELLDRLHPGKKILMMLHRKRISDQEGLRPDNKAFIAKLHAAKRFYHTPPGSNDDWYWMWAAVKAREQGLLISNDELRDHIFSLLRPKHFLRWKQGHIAHYTFKAAEGADAAAPYLPEITYPAPYTTCVQELAGSGSWMLPVASGGADWSAVHWVCCAPSKNTTSAEPTVNTAETTVNRETTATLKPNAGVEITAVANPTADLSVTADRDAAVPATS